MTQTSDIWYIRFRGKVQGPYSVPQLRQLLERGRFSRQHEVSEDGTHWKRATDIPDLFAARVQRKVRTLPASTEKPASNDLVLELSEDDISTPGSGDEAIWMYASDEKTSGPVAESKLRELLLDGIIDGDTLVWVQGWEDWLPISDVPNFRDIASPDVTPKSLKKTGSKTSGGTNGTATASLILGIVGLALLIIAVLSAALRIPLSLTHTESANVLGLMRWVSAVLAIPPSILAIILGHVARNSSSVDGSPVPGSTRAKIGLILGYVTLSPMILGAIAILTLILAAG